MYKRYPSEAEKDDLPEQCPAAWENRALGLFM
jgi:hypothetical protein